MARKEERIKITDEGRDSGKIFVLTEMPCDKAEKWAFRALLAAGRAGVDIPDDVQGAGMAGVAALGIKSLFSVQFEDAEPLLDEMFSCVKIAPDPNHPDIVRSLVTDDIEEIATRIKLRMGVLQLHVDFSIPGAQSTQKSEQTSQSTGSGGYENTSTLIGTIISSGKATLHELQTVYSVEDAYDILEIIIIDAANAKIIRSAQGKK